MGIFIFLQFTRSFPGTDSMLAGESVHEKLRRERHSMSKRSCVAAESLAEAFLRMARGTVTFLHQEAFVKGSTIIISSA